VTHEELLQAVWPGRILSDSVLKKCVSSLREALRDDRQRIIKTVHGYGYRLVAPVEMEHPLPAILLAPDFQAPSEVAVRHGAALIVDIAATVELRRRLGDAAAGRVIRRLLENIVATAQTRSGVFIKSYGDDVLAVFEQDPVNSAAAVAIAAQRAGAQAGLQLYAGLHEGAIEFRRYMGHPDAQGLTVNIAARLHKLTEGAPGRIFLAQESVAGLSAGLRAQARPYGARELKGVGTVNVWTLDWQEVPAVTRTVLAPDPAPAGASGALVLRHGAVSTRLEAADRSCYVGRGKDCVLCVPDPEPRVSSTHVLLEYAAGRWLIEDISRNGTWLRDDRGGEGALLPYCTKALLPRSGALCLGRSFADDPGSRFTVNFAQE
jgi:class 3 adenylate cyclase